LLFFLAFHILVFFESIEFSNNDLLKILNQFNEVGLCTGVVSDRSGGVGLHQCNKRAMDDYLGPKIHCQKVTRIVS
jgi:hypothetical protein